MGTEGAGAATLAALESELSHAEWELVDDDEWQFALWERLAALLRAEPSLRTILSIPEAHAYPEACQSECMLDVARGSGPVPLLKHFVDQKMSVTPSILQRMKNVCGSTNFSLILRNSEHMMRYIIAGTSESTSSPGCHPAMLRSPLRTAASAVKTGHHRSRRKGGTVGCCLRG